jgi:hypothetical protein
VALSEVASASTFRLRRQASLPHRGSLSLGESILSCGLNVGDTQLGIDG